MARNTEPRLIAPEDAHEEQRTALALFLDTLSRHAAETAAILGTYHSPGEVIADSRDGQKGDPQTLNGRILRVLGPVFETEIDLDAEPDDETVVAMRRGISQAEREGADREQRRVIRMATFAGEVATWKESEEMMRNVNGQPSAIYHNDPGSSAPPPLAVQFIEPAGLPETA